MLKNTLIPLITASEAADLSWYRPAEDADIAYDIYTHGINSHCGSYEDRLIYALSVVWNAGRIQGIREERRRLVNTKSKGA